MIPVELTLKNFLSYGEDVPSLDFTEFHVACLSGANGQGKSALLEALIWCIWGEGRKGSQDRKADNGLLRTGKEHMQVDLIFELEGDRYRITRSFSHVGKTSKSGIEFQTYNTEENKYVSLTCPSTRETQDKINKTLRLDYQTFINSAFIMQGKANEFSKKTARERKEVLTEILELSRYDDLADLAKSYLRDINNTITAKDSRLEYIAEQLIQFDFYKSRIKELTDDHARITKTITEKEGGVAELKDKLSKLRNKSEQYDELVRSLAQQRQDIFDKQREIDAKKAEIAENEEVISQKETILAKDEAYQKYHTIDRDMQSKLKEIRSIEDEKAFIKIRIDNEKSNLVVDIRTKQDRYQDLLLKSEQGGKNKSELSSLESKITETKTLEKESESLREIINKARIELNTSENKMDALFRENKNNEEKVSLLKDNPESECPLCKSKLTADNKGKIEADLNKNIEQNRAEIEKLKGDQVDLKGKIVHSLDKQNQAKSVLVNKDIWQQRLNKLQLEQKEAEKAASLLTNLQTEISGIKKVLEEKSYALEDHKRMAELTEQMENIGYNWKEHSRIGDEMQLLYMAPTNKAKLEEAEKKVTVLKDTLSRLQGVYQQKIMDSEALRKKIEDIKIELEGLSEIREKLVQQEDSLKRDLVYKDDVVLEKGRYQSQYDQCLKLQEEKNKMESELEGVRKGKNIYEKLIVAFGKNGIQALIIENALPEIEDEANNLLAKLTSNGTQISMDSLKDLKSGKLKETLEIKISDELGVRDYELYSGGEAFRIDFSIRIALSKLLARRAGTKLRTLIIDEGFGTQDEEGLENIVEAIRSISEDFDKILVITHLETLKNAFPVKIEVIKYPETGSQYKIIKN